MEDIRKRQESTESHVREEEKGQNITPQIVGSRRQRRTYYA